MFRPQQYYVTAPLQHGNHQMPGQRRGRRSGRHSIPPRSRVVHQITTPHNTFTIIPPLEGTYRMVPYRPMSRVQQLEARLEANIPAPDPQEAVASFLGVRVSDLNPEDIIDPEPFKAAVRAQQTYRARVRKANINLSINRSIQNPLHFLALPQDIRNNVYDILFRGAVMKFAPEKSRMGPVRQGQSDMFEKYNLWTDILFVCKDIHTEALRILFANLIIDANGGGPIFDQVVSLSTRERASKVWIMDPRRAFSLFSRLQISVFYERFVINSDSWTEFTRLNSKQMYIDMAIKLDANEKPDRNFLDEVRMSARLRHTSFVAKINLVCCYKIGQETKEVLFRLSSETLVCQDRHDSVVSCPSCCWFHETQKLIVDHRVMSTLTLSRNKRFSIGVTRRVMMLASWPFDECKS